MRNTWVVAWWVPTTNIRGRYRVAAFGRQHAKQLAREAVQRKYVGAVVEQAWRED